MGNIGSFRKQEYTNKDRTLPEVINFIATNYILTQNYQDMINLNNIDYCDKLIILTSDIISKNLNYLDIKYLSQRLKHGEEINEMSKNNIIYMNKQNIENFDLKNKTNKKRMCIGIAKFYIKIAHLFAAIVTTINPTYTFKDLSGNIIVSRLDERHNISELNLNNVEINLNTLCNRRINALLNNQNYNVSNEEEITIQPQVCNININDKKLGNESGIPELEYLYYDKYNYDKGVFGGRMFMKDNMSEKMYKEYQNDLLIFYKKFTGNDNIPFIEKELDGKIQKVPSITKFSQIPLKSYDKTKGCLDGGIFTKQINGTLKEKLFSDYANHIKSMIQKTEISHNKLLEIIDKIFVIKLDSEIIENIDVNTEKYNKKVNINPKLTDETLQEIIDETRKIILNLYLNCEEDFNKGLEIFEAIVENQIIMTSKEQINELQKLTEKAVSGISSDAVVKLTQDDIINSSKKEDIQSDINNEEIQSLSILKINNPYLEKKDEIYNNGYVENPENYIIEKQQNDRDFLNKEEQEEQYDNYDINNHDEDEDIEDTNDEDEDIEDINDEDEDIEDTDDEDEDEDIEDTNDEEEQYENINYISKK